MKYKPMYGILCRLVDCEEDFGLFMFRGDGKYAKELSFGRMSDAKKAMWEDVRKFSESYGAEWTVDGKDHCRRTIKDGGKFVSIDVPIWDGENQRDSWIHARWKIVKL